ncbi:MAG: methyltransferase domain-containing protein [Geobacteraceae bacterium]|nr:methyltransferase domain-containing protein [Geobacteraceae bacterium]
MTKAKNIVSKLLPARLKEALTVWFQMHKQLRRNEQTHQNNRRKIEALLKSSRPIKLELGAGGNRGIAGWTYVDISEGTDLTLDLAKSLPFPDNSVTMIYSSHLLEHFTYHDLVNHIRECRRVLKCGGVFSAAVPNARIYLEAYQNPGAFDPDNFCRYTPAYNYNSKIDYINYIAYMAGHHHYMFDEENIIFILKKCGFTDVTLREFDAALDLETRDYETIYVSGVKRL